MASKKREKVVEVTKKLIGDETEFSDQGLPIEGQKRQGDEGTDGPKRQEAPEQLAKINHFTRRPFTADELYIGQLRLANSAIAGL
jgi:hypothetical protein